MEKTHITIADHVGGVPRPIYLTGSAVYEATRAERDEGRYVLTATAHFPSSTPSIHDRIVSHPIPHVNIADAFFGVWNGCHIISALAGYYSALSTSGTYEAYLPLPADKDVALALAITTTKEQRRGRFDVGVSFEAVYKRNARVFMRLSGQGHAIRKPEDR